MFWTQHSVSSDRDRGTSTRPALEVWGVSETCSQPSFYLGKWCGTSELKNICSSKNADLVTLLWSYLNILYTLLGKCTLNFSFARSSTSVSSTKRISVVSLHPWLYQHIAESLVRPIRSKIQKLPSQGHHQLSSVQDSVHWVVAVQKVELHLPGLILDRGQWWISTIENSLSILLNAGWCPTPES